MCTSKILSACIVACFVFTATELSSGLNMDSLGNIPHKETPVSPCNSCSNLVQSFLKAVDETARQSFQGGDAAWESEKLGRYENSELRLIEIQEMVCSDVTPGKDQCYNLAELHEHELENWFYEKRRENVELFTFLCIHKLKVCCPNNTYGPNCIPCPGGIAEPCRGHGKCKNGGTREEPAYCICDPGYTGNLCSECKRGYYQGGNTTALYCGICDISCKDHCRGPGPKNCEVCADGYHFFQPEGCILEDDSDSWKITTDVSNETDDMKQRFENELDNITSVDARTEHSEL